MSVNIEVNSEKTVTAIGDALVKIYNTSPVFAYTIVLSVIIILLSLIFCFHKKSQHVSQDTNENYKRCKNRK
nr:MAG TPA: hypothetical protein [Caudoviricetes sp.]